MAGASLKSLIGQDLAWRLVSLDDNLVVRGQFQPEEVKKSVGSNYSETGTIGRPQPIRQFINEKADRVTFTARCWAQHAGAPEAINEFLDRRDSIEDLYEVIEGMPRLVPELGRPRIWAFSVGSTRALQMSCTVDDIGGISFARLRPQGGDLRGVSFSITLVRFDEYDVTLGGEQALSLVVPVRNGESYESLSKRVYGNATSGEALRRRNPDKPSLAVGDMIHMPPQAILTLGFARTPVSPALARDDDNVNETRRRLHRRARSGAYLSYTLGPEWDGGS